MRDNYEDFEKLLSAKYAELRAMIDSQQAAIEAGGNGGQDFNAVELQEDVQRVYDEITAH